MDKKNYVIKQLKTTKEKRQVAKDLYRGLREVDVQEICSCTYDVEREVRESIECSDECYAAFTTKGEIVAAWGIRKVESYEGRLIWCLGTDHIKEFWRAFALESRQILREWTDKYGELYNAVGEFNEDAIRWLKWLGADFGKAYKVDLDVFIPFTLKGAK